MSRHLIYGIFCYVVAWFGIDLLIDNLWNAVIDLLDETTWASPDLADRIKAAIRKAREEE
ncbi:MAG: hypothetical protein EOM00_15650 [Clostridia bacterium]|nr:hypothetical protein [Clostridia bacterium]